jgi:hypothetical protein
MMRDGASIREACAKSGIAATTLYRERKRRPSLDAVVKKLLDKRDDIRTPQVEASLFRKAVNGNVTACIFWLKNREPGRWRDVQEQHIKADLDVWADMKHDLEASGVIEIDTPDEPEGSEETDE